MAGRLSIQRLIDCVEGGCPFPAASSNELSYLRKLPVENQLVFESEAAEFTNRLAQQMEEHDIKEKTASVTGETIVAGW